MTKTVLVTGASGFIAQQLILDLLDKGYQVRGTVRSLAKGNVLKDALRPHNVKIDEMELVECDLESDKGWDEAVAGVDVIQHLASPFPMSVPKDPNDLIRPARDGALRVLKAAKKAGINRVIMTSSFAAVGYGWGDDLPEVCTEEHWTNPNNTADCRPYMQSKTLAERAAWEYVEGEGKGIQLTAINPVAVFGPIRSEQVKTSVGVVAQLMGGKIPALPNVGIQVVDVRDVSAAHIATMENDESIGERYILADEFFSMKECSQVLKEAFPNYADKLPTRSMPDFLVKLIALFSADMKSMVTELNKRRMGSSDKVKQLLGRDLIPGRDAFIASGETLIDYKVV